MGDDLTAAEEHDVMVAGADGVDVGEVGAPIPDVSQAFDCRRLSCGVARRCAKVFCGEWSVHHYQITIGEMRTCTNYLRDASVGTSKGMAKQLFFRALQLMPIALITARVIRQHHCQPHARHLFWLTRRHALITVRHFGE